MIQRYKTTLIGAEIPLQAYFHSNQVIRQIIVIFFCCNKILLIALLLFLDNDQFEEIFCAVKQGEIPTYLKKEYEIEHNKLV